VSVRVLTGILSPSSYGELILGVTLATLIHQSLMGPISHACIRYFSPAQESGRLGVYLKTVQRLVLGGTVAVAALVACAGGVLSLVGLGSWLRLVLMSGLLSVVSGCNSAFDAIQNAARERVVVAWHRGLLQWLRPLLVLVLAMPLGASGRTGMVAYIVAAAIVLASQVLLFGRSILGDFPPRDPSAHRCQVMEFTKRMRRYAWPIGTWGILTWLQMASDRWALQVFRGTRSVGIYAVVYQLGYYPMVLFSESLGQLVAPVLFSKAGEGGNTLRLQEALGMNAVVVRVCLAMTVVLAALALVFHKGIFALLAGAEYRSQSAYLPLMVLSSGLVASGEAAALMLMTRGTTAALIPPKVSAALLGALLNVGGAYWFDVRGVVLANLGFSGAYFVYALYVARKSH